VYRLLVRKPEGKRPLGRPRRRWIDNIKMDLVEIGLSVVDTDLVSLLLCGICLTSMESCIVHFVISMHRDCTIF
jgi:hypothetical protein